MRNRTAAAARSAPLESLRPKPPMRKYSGMSMASNAT